MSKRKPTRKRVTMAVEVSVPNDMRASQARREVRSLIAADPGDVKAIRVQPVSPKSLGLMIDETVFDFIDEVL